MVDEEIIPEVTPAEGKPPTTWEKFLTLIKQPLIGTMVTALVTFGGTYFAFVVNDKKATVSFEEVGATNFQKLYDLQSSQILALTIKVDKLTAQIESLRAENAELKISQFKSGQDRIIFNNSIDYFPFPYWVKTRDGRMVKLNTAFESMYLKPKNLVRADYIDHFDSDIWTPEESEAYRKSDMLVVRSKTRQLTREQVTIKGVTHEILVVKFPIFLNNEVIGVAGFSFPSNFLVEGYIDNLIKENYG